MNEKQTIMKRCINIDWLECYCIELGSMPKDAEYFRVFGWHVKEREYGTRIYEQMFTLYAHDCDLPFIEIRRLPKCSPSEKFHVLPDKSCHVRLVNRSCYYEQAARLLQEFLDKYELSFMRISRIDICLDFERFDSGDVPQKFLTRYMSGKYSKINQTNISVHGTEMWDGRNWNSVSWGSKNSQISTKLYNKTLELKQVHDKPYIRQAWALAGLIDDIMTMTKGKGAAQYSPEIWRLEFSIKSSVKKWFVIEDYSKSKKQLRSIHNTLDCYYNRQQLLDVFASIASHYFHFKYFEDGVRKDRCKDKKLFDFKEIEQFYKVETVATSIGRDSIIDKLIQLLEKFTLTETDQKTNQICEQLIAKLKQKQLRNTASMPWSTEEITLLRQLVSRRVLSQQNTLEQDIATIVGHITSETSLFAEQDGTDKLAKKGGTVVPPSIFHGTSM